MKATLLTILSLALAVHAYAGSATWNLNPVSNDWNTAANWAPAMIPDGPGAVATFDASNLNDIVNGETIVVDHIAFTAAAGAYSITVGPQDVHDFDSKLTFNGVGIINDSGITQNFATSVSTITSGFGWINLVNSATAGDGTVFTNNAGANAAGQIIFSNNSSAGTATFVNRTGHFPSLTTFNDDSSAANGSFTNEGSPIGDSSGTTRFLNNSSAGNATFIAEGGVLDLGTGGFVSFADTATAGTATFTLERGGFRSTGGRVSFGASSTADHGTFTVEGAEDSDVQMGLLSFSETASAGDAVITLEGGLNREALGGKLTFLTLVLPQATAQLSP